MPEPQTGRTKPIVLLGGGRWGRVNVQVLSQILPAGEKLVWISSHGFEDNQHWLKTTDLAGRVDLRSDGDTIWNREETGGIVIATATHTHAQALERAITAGVPVFCEKPHTLSPSLATRLAAKAAETKTIAGVNLEFVTASFVRDFATAVADIPLRAIELVWHDPMAEERHCEQKRVDSRIPETHDGLPHCLSICSALSANLADCQLERVTFEQDNSVEVHLDCAGITLKASVSRNAPARRRVVTLNDSEAILDFTTEPGRAQLSGEDLTVNWGPPGPLSCSLQSFLDQIDSPTQDWPLAIDRWTHAVRLADLATEKLRETITKELSDQQGAGATDADGSRQSSLLAVQDAIAFVSALP